MLGSLSSEDVFIFSLLSRRRSRVGKVKYIYPGWPGGALRGSHSHPKKQFQSQVSHNQMASHSKALGLDSACVEVDLSDGQFLIAMRCRCFSCNSDAMAMVFGHSYHRNRYNYFCSTMFSEVFSNLRTMCGDDFCGKTQKQRILRHAQIGDILCVY